MPDEDRFFRVVGKGWGGVYSRARDGAADGAVVGRAVKAAAAELRKLGLGSGVIDDALAVRDGRLEWNEFQERLGACGDNTALLLAAERAWLRTILDLPAGLVSAEQAGGLWERFEHSVARLERPLGEVRAEALP